MYPRQRDRTWRELWSTRCLDGIRQLGLLVHRSQRCCPLEKGTINTHQPLAASPLCGATGERGWNQGTPGMNLGLQPSPGFVLVHLKAGLQPSDCADSGERSLRLTAGQEAGCRGHGTAALRFWGTAPFSGMLKQGRQRQLIYSLQGRIQPGTGTALT